MGHFIRLNRASVALLTIPNLHGRSGMAQAGVKDHCGLKVHL